MGQSKMGQSTSYDEDAEFPLFPITMNPTPEFLTREECAAVDAALLTAHGKFNARVAIYALRSLKQIAIATGTPIADLQPAAIVDWVESDPTVQNPTDDNFRSFWSRLVLSALKPLNKAAQTLDQTRLEDLTVPQVIGWFEQEAKKQL
jgi:hypothetical protein